MVALERPGIGLSDYPKVPELTSLQHHDRVRAEPNAIAINICKLVLDQPLRIGCITEVTQRYRLWRTLEQALTEDRPRLLQRAFHQRMTTRAQAINQ